MKHLEAISADAANIVMQHELINLLLKFRQRPVPPAHLLDFFIGQRRFAHPIRPDGAAAPGCVAVVARPQ